MQTFENHEIHKIPREQQTDKITVIVACYNIEAYIERCLKSIQQQTYENLEILVVDDGSKDRSGQICDEIAAGDNRIRVIHQQNAGLGPARNSGMAQATGKYLAFVDGDDYIDPDMYEVMLSCMKEQQVPLGVCGYYEESADENKAGVVKATAVSASAGETPTESALTGDASQAINPPEDSARTATLTTLTRAELQTLLVEESDTIRIRNAAWNKLYERSLVEGMQFPARKYEDIAYTAELVSRASAGCFVDTPLYHYIMNRKDSIMNQGDWESFLTQQLPAYAEKNQVLEKAGRSDLVTEHDYMVNKKLLILYSDAQKQGTPAAKNFQKAIVPILRERNRDFEKIYSCRIADPHWKLRMKLFLLQPRLYLIFTAINENVILPLRARH